MPLPKEALDVLNKYSVKGGGFVDTNSSYGVKIAKPEKQNFTANVFKSLGAAASGVKKAVGGFVNQTVKDVNKVGGLFGKLPSTFKNTKELKKIGEDLNRQRTQTIKDFKTGKISKEQFNKRLDAINKGEQQKKFTAINATEAKAEKEYNAKDVLSAYGRTSATILAAAAPFAKATTVLAPGASTIQKVGNFGLRGLDFSLGAGRMPTSLNPLKVGAKVVGSAIDAQSLGSTITDAVNGKFDPLNTTLTAASFVPGGPLGIVEKAGKIGGKVIDAALYSKSGVFDKIAIKGGTILSEAQKIADPKTKKQVETTLKQFQDFLLQQHGTPKRAAEAFNEYVSDHKNLSLADVVAEMSSFKSAATQAEKVVARAKNAGQKITTLSGVPVDLSKGQIRVGKSSQKDIAAAKNILKSSNSTEEAVARIKSELPQLADNTRNQALLDDIIKSKLTPDQAAEVLKTKLIGTNALMIDGKPITFKNGYHAFLSGKEYATFKKAGEVGDLIQSKRAVLAPVGAVLDKSGLSTKSANPQEQKSMFAKVRKAFSDKVNTMGVQSNGETLSGQKVFSKLSQQADMKTGVSDIRQLRWKEVQEALGTNDAQSKAVLKAYKQSYGVLTTAERGLGGKITDINLRVNPLAAPYSRIQSVARYEKNPFFRAQENIETRLGTAAFTGANARPGKDYTPTIDALKTSGFFDHITLKSGGGGLAGEGASEFGSITAKLSKDQQRNLAAGVEAMAKSKDRAAIINFVKKNPDLMENLRAVVQYPDKGLTSSNFMKALNLVAFPARYNVKVTQYAAKALAKENGLRQVAILGGIKDFHDWQKTPAGIKWASDNSELIGIMKYFTPIGSIESVLKALTGDVKTLRDLGTIGGLPFGVISGVLQGQGKVKLDSPYLDPKTGEVVPNNIPVDARAQLSQALSDIIGTMFTYPGRQVGLPISKKELSSYVPNKFIGRGETKEEVRTDLTEKQKKQQKVLQAGKAPVIKLNMPASSLPSKPPQLTFGNEPVKNVVKPIYRASKAKSAKGKKVKAKAVPIGTAF